MEIDFIKKGIKEIKSKKELISMFLVVVIFLFVIFFAFWGSGLREQDIPNYSELVKDSSSEYKTYINNTNKNIRNLADSDQFKKIKYYKNLIEEKKFKRRENPFAKTF